MVFAACIYLVFGSYIAAMFTGNLPMMSNKEPEEMCAFFAGGARFGIQRATSIKAYAERTREKFEVKPCKS